MRKCSLLLLLLILSRWSCFTTIYTWEEIVQKSGAVESKNEPSKRRKKNFLRKFSRASFFRRSRFGLEDRPVTSDVFRACTNSVSQSLRQSVKAGQRVNSGKKRSFAKTKSKKEMMMRQAINRAKRTNVLHHSSFHDPGQEKPRRCTGLTGADARTP